jgi:hypothetical protein
VMHPDLLNANIRNTQYAVRGELYLKVRGSAAPLALCSLHARCCHAAAADPRCAARLRRRRSCAARARRSSSPTVRRLRRRGLARWPRLG